ncbi:hypothetical protein D3C81_564110 [compost metagenome]
MTRQHLGNALDQPVVAELDGGQVDRNAPVAVALVDPYTHLPTGFIQHPLTDRNDQPGFFGQTDKAVRQQQPMLRMFPAQQGFSTDGLAVLGVELGLIEQAELTLFKGDSQVLEQLQLQARVAVHRHVKEAVTVLASTFGVIHRRIGVTQQLMLIDAIARVEHDANARRNLQILVRNAKGTGNQVDLLGGDPKGVIRLLQLHQQHKFVTTDARQGVLTVQVAAQALRHVLEQQVAHMVTKGIVDRFEAIQVNEHQRKTATLLCHFAHGLFNAVGQQCTVGQAGQGIVQGQLGEFLVGPGQGARELRRARFQASIKHRGQQSHRQHRQRGN